MTDASHASTPKSRRPQPSVFVFGAGIAGLTAAHELAERGFKVTIFEASLDPRYVDKKAKEEVVDEKRFPKVRLGGMAATQFIKSDELTRFPTRDENGNLTTSKGVGGGETDWFATGEHGFRFFPAYYMHIWDTLRRIPIYDGNDRPTQFTVYDNVQRVITQAGTAPSGQPSLIFPREAPRSIAEFFGSFQELWQLGYTPNDMSSFFGRIARYLVTSSRRREQELEEISTYDYLVGLDKKTKTKDFYYSQAFEGQILKMPRILAAFDARHGDARTNLNTYIQLNMSLDRYDSKADGVLNGPTSTAWFDQWYRHLVRLGVKFEPGALRTFRLVDGERDREAHDGRNGEALDDRLLEVGIDTDMDAEGERHSDGYDAEAIRNDAKIPDGEVSNAGVHVDLPSERFYKADYYVVATDAFRAEMATAALRAEYYEENDDQCSLLWDLTDSERTTRQQIRNLSTVLGLEGFTTLCAPDDDALGPNNGERRNPMQLTTLGEDQWDRFQTLSGIQFFFDTEFQVLNGHLYYSTSDWGLSSINQTGLWLDRPRLNYEGYSSIMSVDIGEWRVKSREINKTALDCSEAELAEEVWRQVSTELGASLTEKKATKDGDAGSDFPKPKWFSIDAFLEYDGVENRKPVRNLAPYLVPIKGDWKNRPGAYPWNPSGSSPTWIPTHEAREVQDRLRVWQAKHGGYQVHYDKLVFAGTWTKTFTRMTSMEAASESARHAVNAILDHYLYSESEENDQRKADPLAWRMPYGFVDQELSTPVRFPTPAGDYCFVYDLENREPSDARPTRLLDAEYFVEGLPHPWTLAGIDQAASAASGAGPYGVAANYFDPVWVIEQLRQSRRVLELLYNPSAADRAHYAQDDEDDRSPSTAGLYCRSAMLPTDEGAAPNSRFGSELWTMRPLHTGPVDFRDVLRVRRGNRPGQYS